MLDGATDAGDTPPPEDAVDALRREWEDTTRG